MGLCDDDGQFIKGICMKGRVQAASSMRHELEGLQYLQPTEREHFFDKEKTSFELCTKPGGKQQKYYCVVDGEMQVITGLILPEGCRVNGYHLTKSEARKELLIQRATSTGQYTHCMHHCVTLIVHCILFAESLLKVKQ